MREGGFRPREGRMLIQGLTGEGWVEQAEKDQIKRFGVGTSCRVYCLPPAGSGLQYCEDLGTVTDQGRVGGPLDY